MESLRVWENTQKYITFLVLLKKGNENGEAVTYKMKFIGSIKFMASSHSSLADDLAKGLHKSKCKDIKSCPEYVAVNDDSWYSNV